MPTGSKRLKRIPVMQGEWQVANGEDTVLSAVLGSCVAVCLHDPQVGVGGMSHILLPGQSGDKNQQSEYYGVYLMEILINKMMERGARKNRMQAKLFGGGNVMSYNFDIGRRNAEFALTFMQEEQISVLSHSLGGTRGRRVEFFPKTGVARQQFLSETCQTTAPRKKQASGSGDVEFFSEKRDS